MRWSFIIFTSLSASRTIIPWSSAVTGVISAAITCPVVVSIHWSKPKQSLPFESMISLLFSPKVKCLSIAAVMLNRLHHSSETYLMLLNTNVEIFPYDCTTFTFSLPIFKPLIIVPFPTFIVSLMGFQSQIDLVRNTAKLIWPLVHSISFYQSLFSSKDHDTRQGDDSRSIKGHYKYSRHPDIQQTSISSYL